MSFSTITELCEEIKRLREEKKLTLQKLSSVLRIRPDYLEAIEAAEFEKLPEGYERIFLKTYLKQLDVDIDEFCNEADRLWFKKGLEAEATNKSRQIDLSQFKKIATWVPVIVVLSALIYFVVINFSKTEEKPVVKELTVEEAKGTIDTVITPIIMKDSVKVDSLELRIEVLNTEFFYIKIDSVHEVSKTGRSGESYIYKALNTFNVYVADGSNTRIFLNNSLVQDATRKDYRINYLYLTRDGVLDKSITKLKLEENENEKTTPLNIYIDSTISQ